MKTKARLTVVAAFITTAALYSVSAATRYVSLDSPNPVPPYTNWATAATNIQDAVDAAAAGDTVLVTNGVYAVGERTSTGGWGNRVVVTNSISLESINGPSVTTIAGSQLRDEYGMVTNGIRVVYLGTNAVLSGFTLTNGNAGFGYGGGVSCESTTAVISNCVLAGNSAYSCGGGAYGGTLNNCTLTGNSGGGAFDSTLTNCTLTGNSAADIGGGVSVGTLNNCTLTGNSAYAGGGASSGYMGQGCTLYNCTLTDNSAEHGGGAGSYWESGPCTLNNCTLTDNSASEGGGAYGSTLYNCTLSGNSAEWGGGAYEGTLNNCVLTGNSASYGGGAWSATLNNCTLADNLAWQAGGGVGSSALANCIVAYNAAWSDANHTESTLEYCCTTPLPTGGQGNIAVAPLFVDFGGGDLRLQVNSPCINAGNNAYVTVTTDLDGNPRIVSGTVDIGAYEYQGPGSVISYAWLQQYGLPTDGSADFAHGDADGMNNWQEWRCGTCPTNALSALRLVSAMPGGTNVTVTWQSVAGVNYFLERSTDLSASPPFALLATNIVGQAATMTYTDTNAASLAPLFYRVGVNPP